LLRIGVTRDAAQEAVPASPAQRLVPTQTDHFELVLKVVSSPKGRDGFLGLTA
jgi:hypothetical protein